MSPGTVKLGAIVSGTTCTVSGALTETFVDGLNAVTVRVKVPGVVVPAKDENVRAAVPVPVTVVGYVSEKKFSPVPPPPQAQNTEPE